MPRASQSASRSQDTFDQGGAIVGAFGTEGLNFSSSIDKQHLGIKALDIDLLLEAGLEVKRGDTRELVFLGHGSKW